MEAVHGSLRRKFGGSLRDQCHRARMMELFRTQALDPECLLLLLVFPSCLFFFSIRLMSGVRGLAQLPGKFWASSISYWKENCITLPTSMPTMSYSRAVCFLCRLCQSFGQMVLVCSAWTPVPENNLENGSCKPRDCQCGAWFQIYVCTYLFCIGKSEFG